MEEFRYFYRPQHELSQSPCKVIKMNTDLKKAGKVSFTFDNIAKGTYCVFTYQDVNMDGEVAFYGHHLNEPWGSYKEEALGIVPSWAVVKFDLERDIAGIEIEM